MLTASPPLPNGVLSVSFLNRCVRDCLESAFPLTWVGGEVSNLTNAASGHVYFSLKDSSAQVRCVMWRSKAQTLGWRLENGQQVEARALVSFYEPRGEFQLNIEAVRRAGQGDLFERFLRLKAQLEAEGVFSADRKRPLPAFPRHIAIVSSLQAAALRDVLTTLQRRAPYLHLSIFPTLVQGEGAGSQIAAALGQAGASASDLIILCRGGGSIEDLWAFNEEAVARAIHASAIPVITGIGHETDFTIADFAADLRAPTPTAAAELASPDAATLLRRLEQLGSLLQNRLVRSLNDHQQRVDGLSNRLQHPAERLHLRRIEAGSLGQRLHAAAQRHLELAGLGLHNIQQRQDAARPRPERLAAPLVQLHLRLGQHARWALARESGKLNLLGCSLKQLDPHAVLDRGYALAMDADGRAIRDASSLKPGQMLKLGFARGEALAKVHRVVATPEAD